MNLQLAREMLLKYIEAEKNVLLNQSYTIGNRTYTRANLNAIREGREYWQKVVDDLTGSNSAIKVRRILFRDDY